MVYYTSTIPERGTMAIRIEIDTEVQQELAMRASKEGINLFSPDTPNRVLRIVLEIDQPPTHTAPGPGPEKPPVPSNSFSSTSTNPPRSEQSRKRFGSRLLREHGLSCKKSYFSKTGKHYEKPDVFPAVLFDPNGFFIVRDEHSMRTNSYINVGVKVSIPGGISGIPGYVKCEHVHD